MSLPPGFLDDLRSRVTLSRVVGRKVAWDARKSNAGKGDFWAPCPFHQEKTASFHVDDRKGFYYCFGCHAKGDAVTFLKETENLSFMEAVESLAREAGLPMPARDAKAAEAADRRSQLVAVLEEAVKWFRLQLKTQSGAAARAYLERRRLSPEAQARWDIGYAPDQSQALLAALREKGFADDLVIASGVIAKAEDGRLYDRFRGRIIFPIRDGRGRCISFGGRALDPKAQAKYLNGPETELFDKGRNLFNLARAREAAGKNQPVILAEGYMDVIALVEAGFLGAVAPLGTAVTEDQLRLLWRLGAEPFVALDGDTAGLRAAARLADLALPLLEAGQGLRFVLLPEGQDPDDLIKAEGPGAMQKLLDAAQPMARLLWQRETTGVQFDSPERFAALRQRLRALVQKIRDRDLRRYYAEAFQHWEASELRPRGRAPEVRPRNRGARAPSPREAATQAAPATRATLLALSSNRTVEYMRETAILAICLRQPAVIGAFETALDHLEMIEPAHQAFLQALLEHHGAGGPEALYEKLCGQLGADTVEKLLSSPHIRVLPPLQQPQNIDLATATLAEQLAKLSAERGLRQEIAEAKDDMDGLADESVTFRLARAVEAHRSAEKAALGEAEEAGEDRAALSQRLQEMIDQEIWVKKRH